jgi:hypothetical protein
MSRKALIGGRHSGAATEPFVAKGTAKSESFRSALSRARFNKAIGKLADKAFATKSPRVKAAYGEAKTRSANAWKKSSDFQTALHHAVFLKTLGPLAKFLESKVLLTRSDRLALARFVRSWEAPKLGRPPGPLSGEVNAAQRNAVYLVRVLQRDWLKENNRQRVPASVTDELIAHAINEASKAFPRSPKLSPGDIRALVNKASRKIID